MYIFELLINALKRKKKDTQALNLPAENEDIIENSEECTHLFMPLDSTNTMFACKYCGLVVPKEKLKKYHISENKSF